ncbi:hypothetical protein HK405_007901, partial [Cladochytrium tenue]
MANEFATEADQVKAIANELPAVGDRPPLEDLKQDVETLLGSACRLIMALEDENSRLKSTNDFLTVEKDKVERKLADALQSLEDMAQLRSELQRLRGLVLEPPLDLDMQKLGSLSPDSPLRVSAHQRPDSTAINGQVTSDVVVSDDQADQPTDHRSTNADAPPAGSLPWPSIMRTRFPNFKANRRLGFSPWVHGFASARGIPLTKNSPICIPPRFQEEFLRLASNRLTAHLAALPRATAAADSNVNTVEVTADIADGAGVSTQLDSTMAPPLKQTVNALLPSFSNGINPNGFLPYTAILRMKWPNFTTTARRYQPLLEKLRIHASMFSQKHVLEDVSRDALGITSAAKFLIPRRLHSVFLGEVITRYGNELSEAFPISGDVGPSNGDPYESPSPRGATTTALPSPYSQDSFLPYTSVLRQRWALFTTTSKKLLPLFERIRHFAIDFAEKRGIPEVDRVATGLNSSARVLIPRSLHKAFLDDAEAKFGNELNHNFGELAQDEPNANFDLPTLYGTTTVTEPVIASGSASTSLLNWPEIVRRRWPRFPIFQFSDYPPLTAVLVDFCRSHGIDNLCAESWGDRWMKAFPAGLAQPLLDDIEKKIGFALDATFSSPLRPTGPLAGRGAASALDRPVPRVGLKRPASDATQVFEAKRAAISRDSIKGAPNNMDDDAGLRPKSTLAAPVTASPTLPVATASLPPVRKPSATAAQTMTSLITAEASTPINATVSKHQSSTATSSDSHRSANYTSRSKHWISVVRTFWPDFCVSDIPVTKSVANCVRDFCASKGVVPLPEQEGLADRFNITVPHRLQDDLLEEIAFRFSHELYDHFTCAEVDSAADADDDNDSNYDSGDDGDDGVIEVPLPPAEQDSQS